MISTAIRSFFLGNHTLEPLPDLREKTAAEESSEMAYGSDRMSLVEEQLAEVVGQMSRECKQLQSIFDAMPQCIYVSDMITHEIYYINPALKSILGRDVVGEKCHEVLSEFHEKCGVCNNDKLINGSYPVAAEYYCSTYDRYFQTMVTVIDWPGVGIARLEVATDISGQKRIEEELVKHRYELEALSDASYEAIAIHRNNTMITANAAFQSLTGYTKKELLAMKDLIGTLFPHCSEEVLSKVTNQSLDVYKATITPKDGEDKEIIIKPNYVTYNHSGDCRCAAIITHKFIEERSI